MYTKEYYKYLVDQQDVDTSFVFISKKRDIRTNKFCQCDGGFQIIIMMVLRAADRFHVIMKIIDYLGISMIRHSTYFANGSCQF